MNYDENGGFFDHVPPPAPGPLVQLRSGATPLAGLPADAHGGGALDGEYVTTADPTNAAGGPPSDWYGVLGPAGLGFRTPALVISPFSAGGWVCSETFDHITTLKLIETLFLSPGTTTTPGVIMGEGGLHVSQWRYDTVGDMTSALPNLSSPTYPVPSLPATSMAYPEVAEQALLNALAGTDDYAQAYPPPTSNTTAYLEQDPEHSGFSRRSTG